jgi:hypothetical protein
MNSTASCRAFRALPTLLAVGSVFLFCTGCDQGWQVYQQIEVGRPLAKQSPLKMHWSDEDPKGTVDYPRTVPDNKLHVWSRPGFWGFWPLPWSTSSCKVSALVDANGLAVAKSYEAWLAVNYLVVKTPARRWVREIRVPESLLTLADRKALQGCDDAETDPLLEYLYDVSRELDFTPRLPQDVNMLIFAHVIANYYGIAQTFSMDAARSALTSSLGDVPLDGISREGFDRTYHTVPGGSLRVQNLGGGRIRIETNLLRFYDPLDLAALLYPPWY